MKPSLTLYLFVLLSICTWSSGDLKANPEFTYATVPVDCNSPADAQLMPTLEYPCYPPSWTNCYNITQNSATWQWESCYGADGYTVQWRYPGGSWYNLPGTCYNNWINVTNLDPCSSYEWRVRANCNYNYYSDWCSPYYFTTICNYCPNPDWLTCNNITNYSATWKWASCYGADYYWVQWRYPGGYWYDLPGCPIYGTWCNVTNLSSCTTYEYRVRSHCNYGWSDTWCYPYTFTTTCNSYCPPPNGLITKDIYDTKATFKWSPVYGASSYSVQIRDPWGNWYDLPGSPTSGVWITANNLQPCKTYEWRVKANCNYYENSSIWSKAKSFTTSCTNSGCHAPDWVYTNGISSHSATLHWASVYNVDYYVVEWRVAGGTWYELAGGPFTNNYADLTGLVPGTNYEWRVKSHCKDGKFSDFSSVTYFKTLGDSCGLPLYRYTLPITDSTATFHWSSVPGALNYTIQIKTSTSNDWLDIAGSPTADTAITATGLLPNTQYEWRMQVNCANGAYSNWLSTIKFTTGQSNGCNTPGNLYTDSLNLTSAVLTWDAVTGAETYSVEIRLLPAGAWNPVVGSPVDTNRVKVDGLTPFTPYEWRVRTNCAGGLHSFWSGGIQFTTTDAPPCSAPINLLSDSISETTAKLHWDAVVGAQAYQVQVRLPNGNWVDIGLVVGETSIKATGLTPNTAYEWHVRSKCDSGVFSNWSQTATFSTTGTNTTNDECSSAILLTVENDCVSTFGSNIGATPSNLPPAGGCPSNGANDVWFKFTMPDVQNPTVTIRTTAGSLANAVMEVYTGTDCSILSVITCEDNNENGNGSSMPVINLTGTPSTTIWVRVWGYDGATGTFTICVLNYISFNYQVNAEEESPMEDGPRVVLDDIVQPSVDVVDQPLSVSVIPNPANDHIQIRVQQTTASRVTGLRMMDLSGKVITTQDIEPVQENQFRYSMDVSALEPGMYVLQVQTSTGMMAEKVTIVR